MFKWDKSITCIEVDADKVLHLFKSMREVQLALPGVPAQQSSAYLCQYLHGEGVATVAAFHLHKSNVLAFYPAEPLVVEVSKTDSMLDAGLDFVESMGFLMTDQDIHLLEGEDRKMLWEALPLKFGGVTSNDEDTARPPAKPAQDEAADVDELAAELSGKPTQDEKPEKAIPLEEKSPVAETETEDAASGVAEDVSENVDDLLAAVEAMRAKRPGLRARRAMPSKDEMDRRKQELRENIGRILASQ